MKVYNGLLNIFFFGKKQQTDIVLCKKPKEKKGSDKLSINLSPKYTDKALRADEVLNIK